MFVETARQLKMTKEGETVDPIVEISCMNEKKYTSAKDDIGAAGVVQWNEHIFFEPRNVVSLRPHHHYVERLWIK